MQNDLYELVTGEQIRAARALLRLDQVELARRAGLSPETIKRLEAIRGPVAAQSRTVAALRDALASLGVDLFTRPDGSIGVRLTPMTAGCLEAQAPDRATSAATSSSTMIGLATTPSMPA